MRKKRKSLSPIAFFLTFLLVFQTFTPVAYAEDIVDQGSQYAMNQDEGNQGSSGNTGQDDGTEPTDKDGTENVEKKDDGTEPTDKDGTENSEKKDDGTEPSHQDGAGDIRNNGDEKENPEGLENKEKIIGPEQVDGLLALQLMNEPPSSGTNKTSLMQIKKISLLQGEKEFVVGEEKVVIDPTNTSFEIKFQFSIPLETDIRIAEGIPDNDKPDPESYVRGGDIVNINFPEGITLEGVDTRAFKYQEESLGSVDRDGNTAKITFSNIVDEDGANGVSAWLTADLKLNEKNDSEEEKVYLIEILGKTFKVVVPGKTVVIDGEKKGDPDVANGIINWTVRVQPKYSDDSDSTKLSLDGYTFEDNLSNVGNYVTGSFYISSGEGSKKTISVPDDVKSLPFSFDSSHKGTQYLYFQTKIPDSVLKDGGKISNIALIKKGEETKGNFTKEIVISKPTWITKVGELVGASEVDGAYQHLNREIKWTIIVNEPGATIVNAQIIDVLPPGLSYKSGSAILDYSEVGTSEIWTRATIKSLECDSTGESPNQREKLTFKIGEEDANTLNGKKARLTFITKVNDPDEAIQTTIIKNEATFKGDGFGEHTGISNEITIGIQPITKKAEEYTSALHTMKWSVTVETKKQGYGGANNLYVLDLLVHGQSIGLQNINIPEELKGIDLGSVTQSPYQKYNKDSFSVTGDENTNKNLKCEVYHLYEIADPENPVADLLVVKGIDINKENTFTFETVVTNPSFYASNVGGEIKNTASLYNADGKINSFEASYGITSNMLSKRMLERADAIAFEDNNQSPNLADKDIDSANGFRYDDKTAIFKIFVNKNGLTKVIDELGQVTVKDTLPKGWEFINFKGKGQSYAIYNAEGVLQDPDELLINGRPALTMENEQQAISFTFKKLDQTYIILVKAGPTADTKKDYFTKNDVYNLKNSAEMTYEKFPDNPKPTSSQEIKVKSEILVKDVDPAKLAETGMIEWTVNYKPYGTEYSGKYIEDKLPIGIDFPLDAKGNLLFSDSKDQPFISVVRLIRDTKSDGVTYADGNAFSDTELSTYIKYDSEARIFTFTFPEKEKNQAYRLTYKTFVSADAGELTNTVSLYGEKKMPAETKQIFKVQNFDAGAEISWAGSLKIVKQRGNGDPLEGAVFALYDKNKTSIIKQSKSNASGIAWMRAIIAPGEYILKEKDAPTGYTASTKEYKVSVVENANGRFITRIEGSQDNSIIIKNYENGTVGDLQITKLVAGNAGDKTKEFEFTLTLNGTGANKFNYIKTISGLELEEGQIASGETFTLADGQAMTIKNISKEIEYTVSEKDYRSEGYRTESNGSLGVITADVTQFVDFTNTKNRDGGEVPIPKKGSVTVVKVDADSNKTLSGAVFQLLDRDKDLVSTSGTTGSNGNVSFDDLDLDVRYYIKEKTAPDGYEKLDELHSFILRDTDRERNITIEVENKKTKEETPKTPDEEKPKGPEEEKPTIIDPNNPPTTGMEIDTPKNPDKKDPDSLYDIDPNGTPTTGIFDNDVPKGSKELDDTPKTGENTLGKNGAIVLTLISGCGLALLALLKRKKFKA